mmetsp:Transcript_16252/g.37439  ORF Transcript_16252/g.37439 Transcript_16252/m.37439 type:complete len:340 (+) Transcript_16252:825-1844(+)
MAKDVVVPRNGRLSHRVGNEDFPAIIVSASNEFSSSKGLDVVVVAVSECKEFRISLLSCGDAVKLQREFVNIVRIIKQTFVERRFKGVEILLLFRREHRQARKGVASHIEGTFEIFESGREFFKEKTPVEEALRLQIALSQVFVVGTNTNWRAIEDTTVFFKDFSDAEGFQIGCRVTSLSRCKLAGKESNRLFLFAVHLVDGSAQLDFGGVSFNDKFLVGIRIVEENFLSNHGFDSLESIVFNFGPGNLGAFWKVGVASERSHQFSTFGSVIAIVVDHTNESTKVSDSGRRSNTENALDLFLDRFDTLRSELMAEPFDLLDSPAALGRVDLIAVAFQAG